MLWANPCFPVLAGSLRHRLARSFKAELAPAGVSPNPSLASLLDQFNVNKNETMKLKGTPGNWVKSSG